MTREAGPGDPRSVRWYTEAAAARCLPGGPSGWALSQEVLYRKWRPGTFEDVAGQDAITTTLRNAVASASPSHAYLLTGPRGTGKTSTGRILAKAVNCEAPVEGEPCNACTSCITFSEGRALDLIELDAASNRGIDEVRALRESVGYSPNAARYKVYLVDEVHMLTDAAFNALLKTLEEPPPHVIFVLATTEPHRIPPTISSRCQRFDFRRAATTSIVELLARIGAGEGISVAPGGLELIARQAGGSFRDAVNLLDQLAAYHGHELDIEAVQRGLGLVVDDRAAQLAQAAIDRDLAAGLSLLGSVRDDGIEVRAFVREVVHTLRTLLLLKAGARDELGLSDAQLAELTPIVEGAKAADIVAGLRALGEIDFAGDNYDALPAEIAFAALAVGLAEEGDALAPPPAATASAPAAAEPAPRREAPSPAPREPRAQRATRREEPAREPRPPQPRAQPAPEEPSPPGPEPPAATASPPSAEAPPAEPAPVAGDLATLRERLPEIRETAKAKNNVAGALLNSGCYIKSFEADRVEIGFRFPIHVEKAQGTPDALAAIRDAVGDIVGRPVDVIPVLSEEPADTAPAGGGAPAAAADAPPARQGGSGGGGHLIEEARRLGAVPVEE